MKQTCVLVLGMHRSGTSALTGVLSFLDIYLASIIGGDKNNEKGYFENWKIQQLSDKLLTSIDSSWDDAFFNLEKLEALENSSAELKNIIVSEFKYSRLFAIKDPRACLLYPFYEKSLNELDIDIKVIIPYRNPLEVACSLHARDQISLEKGMLLWAYHFLLAEKFSRGRERIFVSFDELVKNTSNVVSDISKKLTLDIEKKYAANSKKIADFLEPNLKHHNISMDNFSSKLPKIISDILCLENKFNTSDLSEDFDRLRSELFNYQRLFYNKNITVHLDDLEHTKKLLQDKDAELSLA
ncbi:sulfotransferase family protein, partial [Phytopseudomonas seleniipraecipitans]